MARPKKDPSHRRTEQVNVALSPPEITTITEKAAKANTNVTAFVRAAALGKSVTVTQSQAVDFETRQELRRIGNTLNQIAKHMNAGRDGMPASLERACTELNQLFDQWLPHGSPRQPSRP